MRTNLQFLNNQEPNQSGSVFYADVSSQLKGKPNPDIDNYVITPENEIEFDYQIHGYGINLGGKTSELLPESFSDLIFGYEYRILSRSLDKFEMNGFDEKAQVKELFEQEYQKPSYFYLGTEFGF